MPQQTESRFDFRGGVNRSFSPDVLDQTELVTAQNLELVRYGGLVKRPGTRRIHDTALPGPVMALHHWIGPQGHQIVAIAEGRLWSKGIEDADFVEVTDDEDNPVAFSETARATFTQHTQFGAAELYIADGTLWRFDGTDVEEVDEAHDGLALNEVYKSRLYASDLSKTVYWSAVSQPEVWSSIFDAGQANAETYDETGITGLKTVGGSLLIFKQNSIARFTGVSTDDIRLDQQTEGVSADVGSIVIGQITRMEEAVFFLSDRGPYIGSEAGIQPVGVKVEREFVVEDFDDWQKCSVAHHKGRRQMWACLPDGAVWCYDYRAGAWTGPHEFPFRITRMAEIENPDGSESLILGCEDGFVREQTLRSSVHLDDVLRDGTGGVAVEVDLTLPDLLFGAPQAFKAAYASQEVTADLGEGGRIVAETSGDECPVREVAIPSRGSGVNQYRFRPAWRGRRLGLRIRETTSYPMELYGLVLSAETGRVGV
jgi:hypothetical protein